MHSSSTTGKPATDPRPSPTTQPTSRTMHKEAKDGKRTNDRLAPSRRRGRGRRRERRRDDQTTHTAYYIISIRPLSHTHERRQNAGPSCTRTCRMYNAMQSTPIQTRQLACRPLCSRQRATMMVRRAARPVRGRDTRAPGTHGVAHQASATSAAATAPAIRPPTWLAAAAPVKAYGDVAWALPVGCGWPAG